MSYTRSQNNRQAILDHLHLYPMKGAKAISNDANINRNSVESSLKYMVQIGEVEKIGAGQATRYKAIATKTVSADQVRESVDKKRIEALTKDHPSGAYGKTERPGYYSQKGGGWEPHQRQGGQGAVRIKTGIQSSAN